MLNSWIQLDRIVLSHASTDGSDAKSLHLAWPPPPPPCVLQSGDEASIHKTKGDDAFWISFNRSSAFHTSEQANACSAENVRLLTLI